MTPRRLTVADLAAINTLQPPDWQPYRAAFERYFTLPCCVPFGIDEEGSLRAMGTLIQFGTSAWIAQLITRPDSQGRGLGSGMLTFLMEEAHRRGIQTLSLIATEQGFPLYVKKGFKVEGEYSFWGSEHPAPVETAASAELLSWGDAVESKLHELDKVMSGENRSAYFSGRTAEGFATRDSDGFFLPRIGEGLVVARTERAGVPLLHRRIDGATRVAVPAENEKAMQVLTQRGFAEQRRMRRMVLGPALTRRPEWLWSRIAGNLG